MLHCCRKWRSSFFNWFYFVINIGSLVASTVVVGVQESSGYGIGFGIPTIFFAVVMHDRVCLRVS
jgi:peptide/histidine transporter 3/4